MTVTNTRPNHGLLTGPWDEGFYFKYDAPPRSKSNYRHSAHGRSSWAEHKAFANAIQLLARGARPTTWQTGHPTQPVKDRPVIVAAFFGHTVIDAGNLDKTILDAVSGTPAKGHFPATPGVVMATDAQVGATSSQTVRTARDQKLILGFARLPAQAPPGDVLAALTSLHTQIVELELGAVA